MNYPQPISLLLDQFEQEDHPFYKVHRLVDLAEAVIKYHTVVIVSDYMQSKTIADEVKGILSAGLKTPSLGIWALFTEKFNARIMLINLNIMTDLFILHRFCFS